jgi:hypothetical protein
MVLTRPKLTALNEPLRKADGNLVSGSGLHAVWIQTSQAVRQTYVGVSVNKGRRVGRPFGGKP